MGMDAEAFWNMSPSEFRAKQKGYTDRVQREYRTTWEVSRWQTCWSINAQLPEVDRKTPADMFPLPWEKQLATSASTVPKTAEERRAHFEALKKKYNKA